MSFDMAVLADNQGSSALFAFTLPAPPEWSGTLASITLSGPAGSITLDGDSDSPMAIVRDLQTGAVRGFLRDPSPHWLANPGSLVSGARGLAVIVSQGIPDATAWHR